MLKAWRWGGVRAQIPKYLEQWGMREKERERDRRAFETPVHHNQESFLHNINVLTETGERGQEGEHL